MCNVVLKYTSAGIGLIKAITRNCSMIIKFYFDTDWYDYCHRSTAYHIAKGGLLSLSRALAEELARFSVRVNMVSPGKMENSVDLEGTSFPMGRPATFAEVARVVLFFLEGKNDYLTGQNVEVAGGL